MKKIIISLMMLLALPGGRMALAEGIPLMIHYQGKVEVAGVPHNGPGYFKLALVDDPTAPTTNYWTNDGSTPAAGAEPANTITLPVDLGLFSVKLGDTNLANMTAIDPLVFATPTLYLRVWFSADGVTFERMIPDRQLVSVPYAYRAETAEQVPELSAVGTFNIPTNPVDWSQLKGVPSGFADGVDDTGGGGGEAASDVVCTGCVESTDIADGTMATGDLAFDPATQVELDTHKSSSDHDGRYYTETELSTSGTINIPTNPVDWTKLKGVPAGFADGIDDTGSGSLPSGTSGQTLRHNGTDWVANSLLFNDGTNVGIGKTPSAKLDVNGKIYGNNATASGYSSSSWSTSSNSWIDVPGMSGSVTLSATRPVLVLFSLTDVHCLGSSGNFCYIKLLQDSTIIGQVHYLRGQREKNLMLQRLLTLGAGSYTFKVQTYTDNSNLTAHLPYGYGSRSLSVVEF